MSKEETLQSGGIGTSQTGHFTPENEGELELIVHGCVKIGLGFLCK